MVNYEYSVARFNVPDLPLDPPEVSETDYCRNIRNGCREEAIEALGTVISRLDELDHDGKKRGTQQYLEELRDYLERDMED